MTVIPRLNRRTIHTPTTEEFVDALDACDGLLRLVAQRLGYGDKAMRVHALMRREPELHAVHRAWLASRGRRVGSWPKIGTAMPDAQIAAVIDESRTIAEAAAKVGYLPGALWAVAQRRHTTHPLTHLAYYRLLDRKRWDRDPRGRLVRDGIEALRAALPAHGRMTRDEWRRIAREVGATRAHLWPRLSDRQALDRTSDCIEALIELATVIPETGPASVGIGASRNWIGCTGLTYPQVADAFARAYARAMPLSVEEHNRRNRRDWWGERFAADVRRARAKIIDHIVRTYGTLGAYAKARAPGTPTRGCIEMWMRDDCGLVAEALYQRRPRDTTLRPTCDPVQLREPALIMRHVASGDRWWQWGKQVAWVGDRKHSARLMLEQAATGVEMMTRRIEHVGEELWTLDGWTADSQVARWDATKGAAVWRPW